MSPGHCLSNQENEVVIKLVYLLKRKSLEYKLDIKDKTKLPQNLVTENVLGIYSIDIHKQNK